MKPRRPAWTLRRARWYARAAAVSGFPAAALGALAPYLEGCRSVLDVGAGTGILALPLARLGLRVTALEPAPSMFRELCRAARRAGSPAGLRCVQAAWPSARLAPHDLLLAANVPEVIRDLPGFAWRAACLARRRVVVIRDAGGPDKFFFDRLSPLLFGRPHRRPGSYLESITALHALGVWADVRIIAYRFDQPVRDLDEAVAFWRSYLPRLHAGQVERLRGFLRRRLDGPRGDQRVPIRKVSAVLAWRPRRPAGRASRAPGPRGAGWARLLFEDGGDPGGVRGRAGRGGG